MKNKTVSAKKNSIASRSVRAFRYCAVPFAAFFAAQSASAAAIVWSGATNAIWGTGASTNWVGGTAPGSGDTAVFNGTSSNVTPDLGAGVTVNTISFETSAVAYTIGTGLTQPLTINNAGGFTMGVGVGFNETVSAGIVLGTDGSTQTFNFTSNNTFATAKTMTFSATASITGSTGAGVKTIDVNTTGAGNFIAESLIANISDGTTGTVKLVKDGDGAMQLGSSSSTMNYSGGTYLNAGTLYIVGNANNLKTGSSLFIAGGTSLGSVNQSGGNYSNIIQQWNGDFSFNDSTRGNSSMQQMTFNTGTVDLGATGTDTVRTVNALSNTLTVNSIISNGTNGTTTGLTKTGAGTMVLGGINTYTGTTTVNAGTLTIAATPTGGGAYAALGSGTLNISGATGSLINSSAITIAGGNLTLTNTTTAEGSVNRLSNSTAITSNGGTLTYNNTTGFIYAENVGNVTLNGGQLNTVLSTNMATGIQTLTFNSLTQNNRSTATFSQGTALNATANIIKVAGATATAGGQIIGPWATTGTSATVQTDYAVYDAAGNIVAANIAGSLDSTWTDSTKAYTSNFLGGGAGNALSAVTHNMAALRNLPAFGNTGTTTTIAIPTGGNLNTYGLLNANTNTWTINQVAGSTGALSTPTGGGSIYINTGNGTGSGNGAITIGAPINDNGGAVSIVKTGTGNSVAVGQGVLTLANVTSNFTGATVINGGAIVLNTSGALADGGLASSLGAASTLAGNLVINGGFLQYGTATTAVSTNRLFSIGAMGGTIDSTGATTATMSFVGTGAMGFASQTGPRTLTLQGSNVGVAASTSGSNSSLSTIALLIGDNSGATSVTKAGAGTWALTNSASTYTGPTTITGGILNVGTFAAANTASSLGKGSATTLATDLILNGGTLQYSNNAAATTNRLFSVGASSGTIDSSAASPSNTLSFTATGAMGFNNTVGARTLTLTGTNTGSNSMGLRLDDFGGLTNLTKSSTGTWVLANAGNTYTGVTTINGGILSVGKLANGGVASSIGASTNAAANLVFNSTNSGAQTTIAALVNAIIPNTGSNAPILKYTGSGDSTDRLINFNLGGANANRFAVLDASGSAAINFTNVGSPTFANVDQLFTLVLSGSNTNDNTFAGVIPNNGNKGVSVVKNGTGTWILSGNNTYSDAAGTVSTFGTTVNQGTLVLSGSPTAATALKTTVNAGGTLKLDYTTNTSKLSDHITGGLLTLAGGTLELSGGSHAEVVGLTTLAAGASSITRTTGAATLNLGAITRSAGATLDVPSSGIVLTATGNASQILVNSAGAYATVDGGADWAAKNAGNTAIVDYSSVGTYLATDATTLGGDGNNDVTTLTDTTLSGVVTSKNIRFNVNEARTITIGTSLALGTSTPAGGGILVTSNVNPVSGTTTINGGILKPGANNALQILQFSPKGLKIDSIVADGSGASALTKGGTGTLTLTNVNTYTGATFVNSGTLTISGTGSLNSGNYAGAITIAQGATLNYTSSANQTLSGGTSGFGNFIWNPSSSSAVLVTGARGATPAVLTIKSGIVSGIVSNLGTGPASDLILDGGIIRTKDGGGSTDTTSRLFTLGTGGGTIQADDLTVGLAGTTTRPTEFQGTGAIAFTGSGTRTLKFESAVGAAFGFSPALGDGPGGATSVIMSSPAGGNGLWALSGANTYTGTTTVNGGTLSIRKTQSVNNGVAYFTPANVTVVSGGGIAIGVGAGPTYFDSSAIATILDSSHLGASTTTTGLKVGAQFGLDTTAGDFTYAGTLADLTAGTSNVFNFAKHGLNTLTLSGNNSYSGTTTIYGNANGGTSQGTSILRAGSATAFGPATTASIVFDQGAFQTINKLQLFGNNITVIGLNSPVSTHRDGKGENYIESGSSDTSGTGTDILTINTPNATTSTWNNANNFNSGISRIQDGSTRRLGITKGDLGTLQLGGTNTYTGGTIINAGTIQLLNATGLGAATSATLTFGPGTTTGKLQINNNSITLTGLNTDAGSPGSAIVENGTAGSPTLTVNNATANTFAGVLQNGSAGTLAFTKGAAGTLTLSGNNTYTGNTTVSAGTLILSGNNVGAITGTTSVSSGAIIQYNSLASINGTALNNVTVSGTMVFGATLSDANIVTGLGRVANGSTGTIAVDNNLSGAFNFTNLTVASLGAVGNVTYSGTFTPNGTTYRLGGGGGALTYSSAITGAGNALTIAGPGTVILSNSGNTYGGTTTVGGGTLTVSGIGVIGAGALTVSGGTLDLATTSASVGAVSISSGTIQNGTLTGSGYTVTGGTITASLGGSGALGTASGTPTLNANNSGFSGAVNVTGGTLRAVDSRSLGTNTVTLNGGNLSLASDGTGTGLGNSKLENISYGNAVTVSASQSITVGQFTAGVGTLNAANKTLQLGALGIGANTLTVTNNNGFGLEFTGTATLSGAPTFSVAGGSNAPIVQGLTLSGKVTGLFGIVKSGTGTLVLSNATNDFGVVAGGSLIDVTNGLVSVSADAQLGQALNQVSLHLSGAGLQLNPDGTGSFAHQINTTTAGGVIDVTQFGTTAPTTTNVATLTAAFNNGAANAIAFSKNGNGILNINVDNTANYTGAITVNAGAIRVSNAGALGATANNTTVANNIGAAVQINGVNTAETFSISNSGINSGGAIENFSGTNDLTGLITLANSGATIGSTSGTLNVKGGIAATTLALTYAGAGNITVSTTAITGTTATQTKIGSGTLEIQNADPLTGNIAVNAGTFKLTTAGTVAGAMSVTPGGILTLDNSGSGTANRLGNGKTLTLSGATFNFVGNSVNEVVGAFTPNAGLSTINLSGTGGTLSFASLGTRAAGGVVSFSGSGPAVQFVATTTVTDSLLMSGTMPLFFGNDFATSTGAANAPISAYAGYTTGDFGGQATSATINYNPTGTQTNVTATKTINTLKLTGQGVTINSGQILTLDAAAVINNGGGNITGGYLITTSNAELVINNASDMTIGSIIGNTAYTITAPLTKAGAGNLTLSALNNYGGTTAANGTTTINQGTLTLGGGNNTLATNHPMIVNNGGTLALGSNSQYLGSLTSTGLVEGSGGNITGTGTLTTNGTNGTFAGNLGSDGGALNFIKAGANTMTLSSAQSTTGTISVIGGGITLKDGGTLLGVNITGGITLNGGTLTIDNTGTKNIADRVKDTAPITMNTGTITYNGRAQFNSTETLGDVTLNTGANMFAAAVGGTGVNSAQLNLTSLTRNAGATMFLNGGTNLGQIGNNSRIVVTGTQTGLTPINGVVPGVFKMSSTDSYLFVGYAPGLGFGELGTAGFAATTATFTGAGATDNVLSPATANVVANQTINALSRANLTFSNGTATGGTDLLTIGSGMTITGRNDWGTTTQRGRITSGTNEFFIFKTDGNVTPDPTVNTVITDKNGGVAVNPTDKVSLVVLATHQDRGPYVILTAPNTYSGGTFVNAGPTAAQGGIELNATAAGTVVIPAGGLTINNNAVVDMVTFAGQIDSSNVVTINGGGMLRLSGNNTLAGLVFNSNGGTNVPTVIPYNSNTLGAGNSFASFGAKTGILTISGNITSNPSNVAVTPLLDSGFLDLNNTSHDITVDGGATTASLFHAGNGAAVTGLTISSAINSTTPASGSITKLGTGVLELITGANTFTGGLNINAGALKASSASALGGSGNVATLNNNAAIWLNATVNGGQTIVVSASGGTIASLGDNTLADNITLNGALNISLADPTLNNTDRQITYSAAITGTGGLTVTGNANNPFNATPKPLLLTNATSGTNTFTGGLTIGSGGRVKPSAVNNIGSTSGSLTVNTGGVLDLGGTDQMVGNFTGTGGQIVNTTAGTKTLTIGNGNTGGGNYAGVIASGTGQVAINKIGTGTITLSGANTSTGSTSANGGTLALDFASTGAPLTNIISASSALSLGGGTLSVQGKSSATNTQAFASTTATSNSTLSVTQNSATSLDVNLAGLTFTGGAGINFTGATGTTVGARFITSSSAGSNDGQTRLGGGSMWNGTGWASITDSGGTKYVTAWGGTYIDAYTGTVTPLGSVVIPNTAAAEVRILEDGSTGSPNTLAAATTTINSLLMSAATTASTIKMNAIGANDTLVVGNGASAAGAIAVANGAKGLTIGESANQGFLTAGSSGASTLALNTQNAAAVQGIVVNSKITNNAGSGAVSISAGGAGGTVTLNGVNTYTGTTAIANGTLEIGGAGQLNGGSYGAGIVIGAGGTLKYNSSATQTFTGGISGNGGLEVNAGNLTISGGANVSSYTGGTVINGGVLTIGARASGDIGQIRGTVTINSGGKLTFSDSLGYSSQLTTPTVININGTGILERTGNTNATLTGTTVNMTGGVWTLTGTGYYDLFQVGDFAQGAVNTFASSTTALISAPLNLRSYTNTFTVADGAAANDLEVSGQISGGFGIVKAGAGLMVLTANNSASVTYFDGAKLGYTGTTTISAGTLQLGNNTTTGNLNPASAIVNNGTFAFNRTNPLVQGTDFNSVISGTGGVSQLGSGTTTLSGFNTYTGATLVSNGTLLVSGSISGSAVTVSGTGTLGSSSGTTGGLVGSVSVTSGGTLAPGASTGILTSTGNLTMSSGSTFAAEVNATGVGTGYDQMIVAGNVNLGGSTLSLTGSFTGNGDVFTLILNNGSNAITGTFNGLTNGSSVFLGGQEFQISYFDIASTGGFELSGGNDVSLLAVPEPGAAVSLLGGLGVLLGLRRRRRA